LFEIRKSQIEEEGNENKRERGRKIKNGKRRERKITKRGRERKNWKKSKKKRARNLKWRRANHKAYRSWIKRRRDT
jgi:hypothetical protein